MIFNKTSNCIIFVFSYYNPGASLFYPVAAAPGLGTLTAAGGGPLAPGTPNGVPTTVALGGLNAAAQAQAALNAAVSASALHHNPAAVLPHTNHQLSAVHHPAISPHLPQHIAVSGAGGPQQQLSTNHLNCHFTNAVESGGGPHAVSVSANSLQQSPVSSRQQIHSSQTNFLRMSWLNHAEEIPSLLHHLGLINCLTSQTLSSFLDIQSSPDLNRIYT